MYKQDVLTALGGGSAVARMLGIKPASVSMWDDIIPMARAFQIERLTKGKLKFDPALYQKQVAA